MITFTKVAIFPLMDYGEKPPGCFCLFTVSVCQVRVLLIFGRRAVCHICRSMQRYCRNDSERDDCHKKRANQSCADARNHAVFRPHLCHSLDDIKYQMLSFVQSAQKINRGIPSRITGLDKISGSSQDLYCRRG